MKSRSLLVLGLICALSSMGVAQERITLADGSRLGVFMVKPAESLSQPAPLVILMGGGPGNASISRDTSIWLGGGFAERGWMVAVPVSPNNRAFRGTDNNDKVEQLIAELQKRADISSGKVLLAGISNGGMSALEIARRNPDNYLGVAAVPALATSVVDNSSNDIADMGQMSWWIDDLHKFTFQDGGIKGVVLTGDNNYTSPTPSHAESGTDVYQTSKKPYLDNFTIDGGVWPSS